MKGLPLTYSKDMQEDKEQAFDAADTLMLALAAMEGMARDMQANVTSLEAAASSGFSTATDLADWLVRELDMPFRDAHHVTGTLVAMAEARGCDLPDLSLADMTGVEPRITEGSTTCWACTTRSPRACPTVARRRSRCGRRWPDGRNGWDDWHRTILDASHGRGPCALRHPRGLRRRRRARDPDPRRACARGPILMVDAH
jgi:hypothetical protein